MTCQPGFMANKTPNESRVFGFNWSAVINNNLIATSLWTASDPSVILSNTTINSDNVSTSITVSGGIMGGQYVVTNTIFSTDAQEYEVSFKLVVNQYNFA